MRREITRGAGESRGTGTAASLCTFMPGGKPVDPGIERFIPQWRDFVFLAAGNTFLTVTRQPLYKGRNP